jgi:hypothetical protein
MRKIIGYIIGTPFLAVDLLLHCLTLAVAIIGAIWLYITYKIIMVIGGVDCLIEIRKKMLWKN